MRARLAGVLAAVAFTVACQATPAQQGVTPAQYRQIRPGMTSDQLAGLLGGYGVPGRAPWSEEPGHRFVTLTWPAEGAAGANVAVYLEDGIVQDKAEGGM